MWPTVRELVLKPLSRRAGTFIATWLVFGGQWACDNLQACGLVTETGAMQVATWIVAAGFVALDVVVSWAHRLSTARKAKAGLL